MIAYKFLRPGAVAPFSGFAWPTPEDGEPGAWVETALVGGMCRGGVHACALDDLTRWMAEELWEMELAGEVETGAYKLRASRGRLLRPFAGWESATADLAADCLARARDRAAAGLRAAGFAAEGERIASVEDPEELSATVEEVAAGLPPDVGFRIGPLVEGSMMTAGARSAPNRSAATLAATGSAYVTAIAAGRWGGREAADAERAEQGAWLARRLGLDGG
jgi:hypothetical protein